MAAEGSLISAVEAKDAPICAEQKREEESSPAEAALRSAEKGGFGAATATRKQPPQLDPSLRNQAEGARPAPRSRRSSSSSSSGAAPKSALAPSVSRVSPAAANWVKNQQRRRRCSAILRENDPSGPDRQASGWNQGEARFNRAFRAPESLGCRRTPPRESCQQRGGGGGTRAAMC